jgi:hypothetical protein
MTIQAKVLLTVELSTLVFVFLLSGVILELFFNPKSILESEKYLRFELIER